MILIINLDPDEFRFRKSEIIKEFERSLGFLIQIKKDPETNTEMIYSFQNRPNSSLETKVYFKIINACIFDSNAKLVTNSLASSLCLPNNPENFNQVLNHLKKDTDLLPSYVSNMTYEAYSTMQRKKNPLEEGFRNDSSLITTLLICLLVSFITGISIIFIVLIRQSNKRIKAPIWMPPIGDNNPSNNKISFENNGTIYETIQKPPTQNIWSAFGKKIDDFSSLFSTKRVHSPSGSGSSNDHDPVYDLTDTKPIKIRKLDNNKHETPDFYPSPPESLSEPDISLPNPVNFKSNTGVTPLMMFVMGRSKLKNSKTSTSYNNSRNLIETDVIDTLIMNGADLNAINNDGESALHLAARFGLPDIVQCLVKNGSDLNAYDNSGKNFLHSAVGSNEYEVVKVILSHCATYANQIGPNIVLDDKYDLIDSKTNDELGETSLIIASRLGFNNIVELLVEFNATVNSTDNEGRSALHWCAKVNNVQAALILIQSGANANMQDNDEKTPFSTALNELCTKEIAELLVKFDAFVSCEDEAKLNKMKNVLNNLNPVKNQKQHVPNEIINRIKQEQLHLATNNFKIMNNNQILNKETLKEKCVKKETLSNNNNNNNNNNNSNNNNKNKSKQIELSTLNPKSTNNSSNSNNKRKLSDTSQTEASLSKKVINVNPATVYTPLTPSPPNYQPSQIQPTSTYPISINNLVKFNEQVNIFNPYLHQAAQPQLQTNLGYNFDDSKSQLNQYYTNNAYCVNEHSDNVYYDLNKNNNYYDGCEQNQSQSQQYQQTNFTNSSLYYGEGYAAYF